jgi:hypothetical protein
MDQWCVKFCVFLFCLKCCNEQLTNYCHTGMVWNYCDLELTLTQKQENVNIHTCAKYFI